MTLNVRGPSQAPPLPLGHWQVQWQRAFQVGIAQCPTRNLARLALSSRAQASTRWPGAATRAKSQLRAATS